MDAIMPDTKVVKLQVKMSSEDDVRQIIQLWLLQWSLFIHSLLRFFLIQAMIGRPYNFTIWSVRVFQSLKPAFGIIILKAIDLSKW